MNESTRESILVNSLVVMSGMGDNDRERKTHTSQIKSFHNLHFKHPSQLFFFLNFFSTTFLVVGFFYSFKMGVVLYLGGLVF